MPRHFTREEIDEIRAQLVADGVKDSALPETLAVTSEDFVAIVQEQTNKRLSIETLAEHIREPFVDDHTRANEDHTKASEDHSKAVSDHNRANSDHNRAQADHETAVSNSETAQNDHTRAVNDHTTATGDHNTAASDHSTAAEDHTLAAGDHTQATADHAVMAGYDTRLGNVESEVSQLGQKVVYINVGKNLLNLNSPNIITGKHLNSSGRVATGTSDYNISDYIPVKPNTAYCLTNSTDAYIGASGYVAFYDSTKTLTGTPVKTTNFTTPQGASFLRCTFHNSNITDAMLNEGSIRGPYKPYNAIGGYPEEHEDTELRNRLGMAPIPVTEPNKIIDLSGNIGTTIPSPSATSGTWKYYKYPVTAGDIVVVNGTGGSSARLWGFVDNNDKLLDAASGAVTGTNLILVAPANAAYVVINDNSGSVSYYMPKDSAFFDIRELGAEKIDVALGKNLFDANSTDFVAGKYFNSSGAIAVGEPYAISDYIAIEESTNYTFSKEDGNYAGGSGYMCFYNAYYQPVGSPVANLHFTTPEGAAFVRLSVYKPTYANVMLNKGTIRGQYKPYSVNGKDLVGYGSEIWDSKVGLAQARVIEASLADGGTISIPDYPFFAKWGDNLVFFGKFSSFSKLLVGKGTDKYESIWLEIDATNVVLKKYRSEETTLSTQSHGLTINTYIKVVMSFGIDGKLTYTIQSIGGMFRHTDTNTIWGGMGVCFAQPNGMAMTDCHLSIANNGLRETSWFFGDSYFSVADSRWPYYMLAWGYTKGLWIGLSGGSGFSVEPDFERALNYGRPKFAVYCIGMNDGDDPDVNTPTTRWLDGITAFINACNKYAITPILATIPTVPAKSHEGKNKWVRTSGYRYIDFYNAVGADSTGQWYTGYLANDNEHPTVLGGQALATQVLLDFPEIMW